MSLFILPKPFCFDLNSVFRKFWWGFPMDKKHNLTLLGWDKICSQKAVGGLDLRSMKAQNISLVAKIGWEILNFLNLLWVKALSSKFLHIRNFLSASASPSDSWLWKGILKCRPIVIKGAYQFVSSSLNIHIWNDPWVSLMIGFKPSPNLFLPSFPSLTVSHLITYSIRRWNTHFFNILFAPPSASKIQEIHISHIPIQDHWSWIPYFNGCFSVKSTHELAIHISPFPSSPLNPSDWQLLWDIKMQARLKLFL